MNKKKFKNILVVLGGTSGERAVSLESGKACIKALKKIKYKVSSFDPQKKNFNLINKSKTIILGISKDSIGSHLKFKKKYKLKFDLLSDETLEVIKKYGVWGKKSFMGKEFKGIIRTTFLINSNGKIHKIWSNVRVKDHAKEVFKEIKNIS